MLEFQTKGGVVICSFPLLDHCYCILQNRFSLGSTYESLSPGAKARIDGVSLYQCSSGKLTSEAVDSLLSQMELHNGIPGGVDLSGDAFEVDKGIETTMTAAHPAFGGQYNASDCP